MCDVMSPNARPVCECTCMHSTTQANSLRCMYQLFFIHSRPFPAHMPPILQSITQKSPQRIAVYIYVCWYVYVYKYMYI